MAASAAYLATAKYGRARVTTGVTATDGSGSSTAITWLGGAPGADYALTKMIISVSSATGVGDLADSLIHLFVNDGTNKTLVRTIDPGNPAAGSTTVSAYQLEVNFDTGWVLPSGASLEVSVSVTPTAGNVDFSFFAVVS